MSGVYRSLVGAKITETRCLDVGFETLDFLSVEPSCRDAGMSLGSRRTYSIQLPRQLRSYCARACPSRGVCSSRRELLLSESRELARSAEGSSCGSSNTPVCVGAWALGCEAAAPLWARGYRLLGDIHRRIWQLGVCMRWLF